MNDVRCMGVVREGCQLCKLCSRWSPADGSMEHVEIVKNRKKYNKGPGRAQGWERPAAAAVAVVVQGRGRSAAGGGAPWVLARRLTSGAFDSTERVESATTDGGEVVSQPAARVREQFAEACAARRR